MHLPGIASACSATDLCRKIKEAKTDEIRAWLIEDNSCGPGLAAAQTTVGFANLVNATLGALGCTAGGVDETSQDVINRLCRVQNAAQQVGEFFGRALACAATGYLSLFETKRKVLAQLDAGTIESVTPAFRQTRSVVKPGCEAITIPRYSESLSPEENEILFFDACGRCQSLWEERSGGVYLRCGISSSSTVIGSDGRIRFGGRCTASPSRSPFGPLTNIYAVMEPDESINMGGAWTTYAERARDNIVVQHFRGLNYAARFILSPPVFPPGREAIGESGHLKEGEFLVSPNRRFRLSIERFISRTVFARIVIREAGLSVVEPGRDVWKLEVGALPPLTLWMQNDGNVVLQSASVPGSFVGFPAWASNTVMQPNRGYMLHLSNNGQLEIRVGQQMLRKVTPYYDKAPHLPSRFSDPKDWSPER